MLVSRQNAAAAESKFHMTLVLFCLRPAKVPSPLFLICSAAGSKRGLLLPRLSYEPSLLCKFPHLIGPRLILPGVRLFLLLGSSAADILLRTISYRLPNFAPVLRVLLSFNNHPRSLLLHPASGSGDTSARSQHRRPLCHIALLRFAEPSLPLVFRCSHLEVLLCDLNRDTNRSPCLQNASLQLRTSAPTAPGLIRSSTSPFLRSSVRAQSRRWRRTKWSWSWWSPSF